MYKPLLLCLLTSIFSWAQTPSKKYALIIQNTEFKNGYALLTYGKNNATVMEKSLASQGFPKQNITIAYNLTAKNFRDTIADFTNKLPKNAIVTAYLFSHGIQVDDFSGDEKDQEKDKKDEVFICTDSRTSKDITQELQAKNDKFKSSIDASATAITDDEIYVLNQSLLEKIGPGGSYLCLLDFCHSDGGFKGSIIPSTVTNNIQIKTRTSAAEHSRSAKGTFVSIMASDKTISLEASSAKTGFFVRAIDHAFHRFLGGPTYQEFYDAFQEYILATPAFSDKGKPSVHLKDMKDKLLFNGQWVANFPAYYPSSWRTVGNSATGRDAKGSASDTIVDPNENKLTNRFDFGTSNSHWYLPNMAVDVYLNGQLKDRGIIKTVGDSTVQVAFPQSFEIKEGEAYAIVPSQRLVEAAKKYNAVSKRTDLLQVLHTLHVPNLPITIKNYLNPSKSNTYSPFANKNLVAGDSVCVEMTYHDTSAKLYFTILDVTDSGGVGHVFLDTTIHPNPPAGFRIIKNNVPNTILKSRVSANDPLGKASLWILVSDAPITDKDFTTYLIAHNQTTKNQIEDKDRLPLWNILRQVVYFEPLDYVVVNN